MILCFHKIMFDNNFSQRFRQGASWLGARLKPVADRLLTTDRAKSYMADLSRIKDLAMTGKRAYDQFQSGDGGWLDTAAGLTGQVGDAYGAAESLYNKGREDVDTVQGILKKRRKKRKM